ncbi:type II toxin-antitoxin system Phd/YefM family antitoxin [Streptomyces sp. NRRL WC-3719]|uniref:type II toxin-antitoxin system Phd/YefM family antitoxin n=1 Tax=Streptomyces sp. NRRL WC-3719 TaxID=1463932 RepID=UPI001F2E8E32|nr:type II toxin-antitoxin system Phd/YefM family antitoxin [Streptomyces sp. NRRL WC-3719]
MTENTVTVREARAHLADHINRAEEGVPTVITRNGAPVAAVVPISDFEALEEAADVMAATPDHQPTRRHAHPDRADRTR